MEYNSFNDKLIYKLNNLDLLDGKFNHDSSSEPFYFYKINMIRNIPTSFYERFTNIFQVCVMKIENFSDLNLFLNNLKRLDILKLISVSLDLNFYHNLPCNIREINLLFCNIKNYDFILNFSKLIIFSTNDRVDLLDVASKSFINSKYLNFFEFELNSTIIIIRRCNYKFSFRAFGGKNNIAEKNLNYDQLNNLCKKIRIV